MKLSQGLILSPQARKALLALVFILLGYAGIISHSIGMDIAHADDCSICVQIKTQGHGVTSAYVLPQLPAFDEPPLTHKMVAIAADFSAIAQPRAPPVLRKF